LKVVQSCWKDVSAAVAELPRLNAHLRSKSGAKLEAIRGRWFVMESERRANLYRRDRARLVLWLPAGLALLYFAVLGPHGLLAWASEPPAGPTAAYLAGPGRPWVLIAGLALALAWAGKAFAAWRRARARRAVPEDDCPLPSADLMPKLWDELGHRPAGLEGLRETEGSDGERALASLLAKALGDDFVCLVGPLVAESLDVDLLVIGPSGLWVLDSKYHRGRVDYVGGQFIKTKTLGDRTVEKEFDIVGEIDREVGGVQAALTEPGLRALQAEVRGIVAFTHPEIRLHTLGAPFPCLLPRQVPPVILKAPRVRGLNADAIFRIVDALAHQAVRLATNDADGVKVSARDWLREEARHREMEIADCIARHGREEREPARGAARERGPGDGAPRRRRHRGGRGKAAR
jgi:hypothetical protein